MLDALPESHETEIVKRRRSELLLLTGKGAFQEGFCFAEFARPKLARAGIVELARCGWRSGFGGGRGGDGAET